MPYRRFRRMRRRAPRVTSSVTHVPSTMGDVPAINTGTIVLAVNSSISAGGSATTNIESSDRDRTVTVGHKVNSVTWDLGIRSVTGEGILEVAVLKLERESAIPSIGVGDYPSDATINSIGLQQALRMAFPGRIYKFLQIPFSEGTTRAPRITVNFAKFKKSMIRPGDYMLLHYHNRGTATCVIDTQARYKELS